MRGGPRRVLLGRTVQADLGGDKAKQQHINDKQPSGNSAKHADAKTDNSGQKLSTAAPV